MDIRNILVKYWGYPGFRPMQEEIIHAVLHGHDTLALLPTGGGKSICFQVPAMAKEGVCIVVTPLIALMKDQVENLKKKGIKAVAIHSGMKREEVEAAYDNCRFGGMKFLYVSPERLKTEQFRMILPLMKVNLLAIDEAHCISQWGYDFRPPYLEIAEIRAYLEEVPVLALTATATPVVAEDIQEKLRFKNARFFQQSFERKNLTYMVIEEEDKRSRLLRINRKVQGSGIVYVRNRKKTREIAEFLRKNNISADYYHAGLDMVRRSRIQSAWKTGLTRVIVATNAFGMGIDKPDVRFVVHMDIPDSLEAYFQEAGRAGRDEKRAYAVLLYEQADLIRARQFLELEYPPIDTIKKIYNTLGNYLQLALGSGKEQSFDFDLSQFSGQYDYSPLTVYNSLKFLERAGYVYLNESFGAPSRIHLKCSSEDLYRFQVENRIFDSFIKLLLRSYTGLHTDFVKIDEGELARRSNRSAKEVEQALRRLAAFDIIDYVPQATKPQIVFIVERLHEKDLRIATSVYADRMKDDSKRLQHIFDYASSRTQCRSQLLLAYFGEKNAVRCGRCDVCLERNKVELSELEFDEIIALIKPMLQKRPCTLQELVFDIHGYTDDMVIKVVRWLEDNGNIIRNDNNFYTWKSQYKLGL